MRLRRSCSQLAALRLLAVELRLDARALSLRCCGGSLRLRRCRLRLRRSARLRGALLRQPLVLLLEYTVSLLHHLEAVVRLQSSGILTSTRALQFLSERAVSADVSRQNHGVRVELTGGISLPILNLGG